MSISVEPTPNPNAMKFTVGSPVGGPATFSDAASADDPVASQLLQIAGVVSVFMTADFVTVTKTPDAQWDAITESTSTVLSSHY